MGVLHLVPIFCGGSSEFLEPLADRLTEVFRLRVEQHPPSFDPEAAFDATRGQYNSRILLTELMKNHSSEATRVLGVSGVDLFIPVLTYVFGEAQLNGRAAVVSTFRLDHRIYGLPPNQNEFFERLCKESIHELGHTYNLVHCHRHPCVMMSSTYVDGIDLKSDRFCDQCQAIIEQAQP